MGQHQPTNCQQHQLLFKHSLLVLAALLGQLSQQSLLLGDPQLQWGHGQQHWVCSLRLGQQGCWTAGPAWPAVLPAVLPAVPP
jgi:hypothetical protein